MNAEKIIGYVRDTGCVLVGLGGITYQIVSGKVSVELLTVCMGLLGYAGAANLSQLRPPQRRRSTGGGRPRSSPASRRASPSPSSLPPSDGGE